MNSVVEKTCCGICEKEQEKGFYLYQLFICESCEQSIVNTNPEDSEYEFYLSKLKNITKSIAYS